jgi:NADH-quinone oxidoreductase subunit I
MSVTFPKKPASPTNAVVAAHPEQTVYLQSYLPEVFKGLAVSMKHFFDNTKEMVLGKRPDPVLERYDEGITTISYPEQKRPYPERFRGLHRLTQRDDGSPRCVACLCCSTACPAQCIFIEPGEYPPGDKRRGYERFPVRFVIDELRCIFCGYCVEACPCDAIRMDTGRHAAPYDSRDQFVYAKETLIAFPGRDGSHETANPRHEPGESSHPGADRQRAHH